MTEMEGSPPTQEELDFIIKLGDRSGDGCIKRTEWTAIMLDWHKYTKEKDRLQQLMTKYDKNGSGRLEKDELTCFLTGINNGKECTDEQIDWVMREADIFGDGAVRTQAIIKATEAFRNYLRARMTGIPKLFTGNNGQFGYR